MRQIKTEYPDCAVTLSLGERSYESYAALKEAGADRYLLRHETATKEHYEKLHPADMSFEHRMQCLGDLRELGYAVGAGFMVGAPYQTPEDLARDFVFLQEFRPDMVGIGPFIPHHDTPFKDMPAGTLEDTLYYLSIIRLMLPDVLLPSTTALGTIHPPGDGTQTVPALRRKDLRQRRRHQMQRLHRPAAREIRVPHRGRPRRPQRIQTNGTKRR